MPFYAQIRNGRVTSVVEAHSSISRPDMVELRWLDIGLLGKIYANGLFSNHPPVALKRISRRDFWRRFSTQERVAIANKSAVGPQATKDSLSAFREYIASDPMVELDDPYVSATVSAMESDGILAAGRSASILATE